MTAAGRAGGWMAGVVLGPPRARREDPPRLVDLPHVICRLLVRMEVRMEALREAPMGTCHLLLGGIARNPQHRIRVVESVVWHCRGF